MQLKCKQNIDEKINKEPVKLLFAGDFIPPEAPEAIFSDALLEVLKDKDFSIVNLETPLTKSYNRIKKSGNNFKRPPSVIQYVKAGFFDAVALSNNHIRDYDCKGVNDTIITCLKNSIRTVGAGSDIHEAVKPLVFNCMDKEISIFNYSETEFSNADEKRAGSNPFDTIRAYYEIQNARENGSKIIIIYHGGVEYQYYPTMNLVNKFRFLIDAGADCIISHHTHRYGGAIMYNEKPILFGLGNLFAPTKNKNKGEWRTGLVVRIFLAEDKVDYELIPVQIAKDFSFVDILDGQRNLEVLNHVKEISEKIQDSDSLKDYWKREAEKRSGEISRLLRSNCRMENRIRKIFPKFFKARVSEYKRLNLLNLIQCESHRDLLISILKMLENRKRIN